MAWLWVQDFGGSEISDGAVIGAGTVISGKVEENTICFTKREYCEKARK